MKPAELRLLMKPDDEHTECVHLFHWASVQVFKGFKISSLLVRIPNGAYHGADRKAGAVVARKLREEGLQSGTFDYILPIPQSHNCPGLWLEMKRTRGGKVSQEQLAFGGRMVYFGWRCEIAKGWVEGAKIIKEYLQGVDREWTTNKTTKTNVSSSCPTSKRRARSNPKTACSSGESSRSMRSSST